VALILKGEGVTDYVPWTSHPLTQCCIPEDSVQKLCWELQSLHLLLLCCLDILCIYLY